MIVYSATRADFNQHVITNQIDERINHAYFKRLGRHAPASEQRSWRNSLQYMNNALTQAHTPDDAGIAIEYQIPLTSKRIDFFVSGVDEHDRESLVIVELKQWQSAERTEKDAVVRTFLNGALRETTHPSYQAWTYASLLKDFNVAIQNGEIELNACAYIHNCDDPVVLKHSFYQAHTAKAPLYLRNDTDLLADFLEKHVRRGDRSKLLFRVENSKLRPSKHLADHLSSLLSGNQEFQMIDDQKLVYETALNLTNRALSGQKQVFLVEGGPGTGKSVVAINLLVQLIKQKLVSQYVTRNSAPRTVYESKLTGTFKKTHITNLFSGAGKFIDCEANRFDCLVVDEAHRLTEKSTFYGAGENQVAEIIHAAKCAVFFLDQNQRVTLADIGDRAEIIHHAQAAGAVITEAKLNSQFRCNGSDGYLAWVNNTLQIENTANIHLDDINYDFRVFDSPNELHSTITQRNVNTNQSRVVAGYCWDWRGKRNPAIKDVAIPEHGYARRWNLDKQGMLWIIDPTSIDEVGCIHTCQGLELDYVGVIIGMDLVVRGNEVITDPEKRSTQDRSIRGFKKLRAENPARAATLTDSIIKNTYRTLMTRGQKGCYVYCVDAETNEYFKTFTSSG
ncbi:MAG: DUF2075 domain-containing protein [Gammaproteobacteria bacterium]|nr:DUF2075 domain-containing protein [Gammaproteobacteria bacterium]